jgi:hypothetical protein
VLPNFGLKPEIAAFFRSAISSGIAQEVREVRTSKSIVEGGGGKATTRVLWRNPAAGRVFSADEREALVGATQKLLGQHGVLARSQHVTRNLYKSRLDVAGSQWVAQRELLQTNSPGWSVATTSLLDRSGSRHAARPPQEWATNARETNVAGVAVGYEVSKDRSVYVVVGNTPVEVAKQMAALSAARSGMSAALPLTLAQELRDTSSHFLFTGRTADHIRNLDTRPLEAVEITISRNSAPIIGTKLAELGARPMSPDGRWRDAPLTQSEGLQKLLALKVDDAHPDSWMVRTESGRVDIKVVSESAYQQMYDSRERRGSDRNPLFIGEGTMAAHREADRRHVIDLTDDGPSLSLSLERPAPH